MPRPPGPWLRFEIFFTGEEKEWSNIVWYKPTGGPAFDLTTLDFSGLAAQIQNNFMTGYSTILSNTCKARGAYMIVNDGTNSVGFDYYHDEIGGNATPPIPEECATVVQLLSATPGPNGRGRLYIAGLCTDTIAGSYLSTAGTASFGNFVLALKTVLATTGGPTIAVAVVSNTTGTINQVTNMNTVNLLGTNRKRRTRF